ncbi:MAG TPA: 50S ribosomal protein L11 methyltransferase [Verrucomicrobiales bacterium]|nr:50S ribosomal protein L11 methyltransferase [Verrucomicrobiales bacterium]
MSSNLITRSIFMYGDGDHRARQAVFVWTRLSAARWEDAWQERLRGFGNGSVVVTAFAGRKSIRVDYYTARRAEAERIRRSFGGTVRNVKESEWRLMKPEKAALVKIRDRLVVTSERKKAARTRLEEEYPGRIVLSIPAEMAFGTGGHATTANCLRLLVDWAAERRGERLEEERQLDLGTGTGILALAGRFLGIGRVLAWDYDPAAVAAARRNVRAHGFRDESVEVAESDVRSWIPGREKFEIVTANLFAGVLEEAFPKIHRVLKRGGVCIASGIMRTQEEDCLGRATRAGLRILEVRRQGKWMAFRADRL